MEEKKQDMVDKAVKLKKFMVYEELINITNTLFNKINDDLINILDIRNDIKILINSIISEVNDNEKFFIRMLSYLETPDKFIAHSLNTAIYSYILCDNLDVDPENTKKVLTAALFHDIGKMEFHDKLKHHYITRNEDPKDIWKNHPLWGSRILTSHLKSPAEIGVIIMNHHEQYDGTGFPRGLKEGQLSVFDNIVITSNIIDIILQKTHYSGMDSITSSINSILKMYNNKFAPPIKNILIELYNLKEEGRKYKRYKLSTSGYIESSMTGVRTPCHVVNLSAGGLQISTIVPLNSHDIYKINTRISDNLIMKDKIIQISWQTREGEKYMFGMRFHTSDMENNARLEQIFSEKR